MRFHVDSDGFTDRFDGHEDFPVAVDSDDVDAVDFRNYVLHFRIVLVVVGIVFHSPGISSLDGKRFVKRWRSKAFAGSSKISRISDED